MPYYIFNSEGKCVGSTDSTNTESIVSAGYRAFSSTTMYTIDEYPLLEVSNNELIKVLPSLELTKENAFKRLYKEYLALESSRIKVHHINGKEYYYDMSKEGRELFKLAKENLELSEAMETENPTELLKAYTSLDSSGNLIPHTKLMLLKIQKDGTDIMQNRYMRYKACIDRIKKARSSRAVEEVHL